MPSKAQDDELVMGLVESALARPQHQREEYVRQQCVNDSDLFSQVWTYVEWEQRMGGFLLDPVFQLPAEEPHFEPGALLQGRFRIVREVGRGGMAMVYEATDEKLQHRRIALKSARIGFHQRLPPEVRNATEISHPNVCKIFEIHTTSTDSGDIDFITMEFLQGETLAERLRRGPLPKAEARIIANQILAGLVAAHRNGVIHGDLKSGNIMLTTGRDGAIRAVIMDFGIARLAQGDAQSDERGGTPDYMAPELWEGEQPTVQSDVYAMGVILYELAAGRRLDRPRDSLQAGAGWKPPAADPKWDRIIARCLNADPSRRFQSADELARALAPASPRRWWLTAAAMLVLATGTGIVTYQRTTAPAESVRLAMLPFESDPGDATMADRLFRDTATRLRTLKSNSHTQLSVIPMDKIARDHIGTPEQAGHALGATLVLHGTLHKEGGKLILRAFLTNTNNQINAKDWRAAYLPSEVRYAPIALAGFVTETLKLPPLQMAVNAVARPDYEAGLSDARRDTGVDAAIPLLEKAVAADPDSPLTYAGLAEAQWLKFYATNDKTWLDRATESAREAELRDPDLAAVHRIVGVLDAQSGRYELAEAEYRRAIELEPQNSVAHRRLGIAFEQNNQLDAALAELQRAVELEPQYYKNDQELGAFYFQRAEYAEAAKQFQKTVDLAPAEPAPRRSYATALMNLGRYGEAESQLRSAIHLQETAMAVHLLGYALMYQAREREAIPYFVHSLELDHPQRYLAWFQLGVAYRRLGRVSEAERANREGLRLTEAEMAQNPRDGYVRSFQAYFCARLGNLSRAESEAAQALQLSPTDADTRQIVALTYDALGRRDDVMAVLSAGSSEMLADLKRWPDAADLTKDSRFLELLASRQIK